MRRARRMMGLALVVAVGASTALVLGGGASAAPTVPVDETKVPHYFGPYPNWANSPLATPDVTVAITGDGTGAKATAQVGADGAVTGLTVSDPGSGYTTATVSITGAGSGAAATAVLQASGGLTGVTVTAPGAGYAKPAVAITGGGATTDATAHALGSVGAVTLTDPGTGYSFPTVDFDLPDDPNGIQAKGHAVCAEANCAPATTGGTVTVTGVAIDEPGSGYASAPGVAILDGTQFDPVTHAPGTFTAASARATLKIDSVVVDTLGAGYASAPSVAITDAAGSGSGATATATTDIGAVKGLTLVSGGTGYITPGGIRKFQDTLPGLTEAGKNNLGQYLPVAVADTAMFANADYYVIAVVQHRERMSSSLPAAGTLLREYVQLSTAAVPGKHVALSNDLVDGTSEPVLMPDGTQAYGVDDPHYLGPVLSARKNRAVRIVFYNLLPAGVKGDLFLPTDSSMMGSGMGPMAGMAAPADNGTVVDEVRNPMCTETPKSDMCFKDSRATLHLHGGATPWISDGTPHQWITPANEATAWPKGVSVKDVPDMAGAQRPAGVPDCSAPKSGCQTFYYTNQQSARMLFYHDHSWGITRLNVYGGEAAGYLIGDPTEDRLVGNGTIPADQIPLIIQDKTFVPGKDQLARQDPTWDSSRWGGEGSLWYHHVYMPAQNPGDPSGMSSFGRWMYGPWFWPPATPAHGPIDNPYYNMDPKGPDGTRGTADDWSTPLAKPCSIDDPATWQYDGDPFCEPQKIPGTPNISAGMEQFNDTPVVNGTAYPTTTVQPKAYRMRLLNAANDRFWNLQWYVADPTTGTDSEVALKAGEVAAAQSDPNIVPTPDTAKSPEGPNFVQIGTEGGFLPSPVVVPNQPITWITDPTRFDVGNVDKHALLLAPAERADTIVDFSKYAGKTLILYNDAPAAFPARVACYDYYTGHPDMQPACAPTTIPGYGPNTRTIMQVKVADAPAAPAYDVAALQSAFRHKADGSGVFESGQHPIIVGQAGYNSAYGKGFAASGFCSAPTATIKCDGLARISQQGGELFTFDTLKGSSNADSTKWTKLSVKIEPKAIHDEMNATTFDEFGRMTASLGVEAVPATPMAQNVTLYPYTNPGTEFIDGTQLPTGVSMTAISKADDGTQIWKITHNGVDTHPIHFHLFDVQVINRVTWDNIVMAPDANELGWKDTVRVSPLEDTLVALRPVVPTTPFEVPNSIRLLNPMMPEGDQTGFNSVDVNGNPTNPITNVPVNFGWEYVYHCHILSHEEMDMMRPVSLVLAPKAPDGIAATLLGVARNGRTGTVRITWNDNSIAETAYLVQRRTGTGAWTTLQTIQSPLDQPNSTRAGMRFDDATWTPTGAYAYRVVAQNTVGYGGQFPSMTKESATAEVAGPIPAPSNLTAAFQASNPRVTLTWTDNAQNETGFVIQRSANGGATFTQVGTAPARNGTGTVTFADTTVSPSTSYVYRVAAVNAAGQSPWSGAASVSVPFVAPPGAPTLLAGTLQAGPQIALVWRDNATNENGFVIERSDNGGAFAAVGSPTANGGTGIAGFTDTTVVPGTSYRYRVKAVNIAGSSAWSNTTAAIAVPTPPLAPTGLTATAARTGGGDTVTLRWTDNATNEAGFTIERSTNPAFTNPTTYTATANAVQFTNTGVARGRTYYYRVQASNLGGASGWSNVVSVLTP